MNHAIIATGLLIWSMAGAVIFCIIISNFCDADLERRSVKVKLSIVSVLCGPVTVMGCIAAVLFGCIAKLVSPSKVSEWIKR